MRKHKLTVYPDKEGLYRWRCKSGNGRTVDASEQGYVNRWYAVEKAQRSWPDALLQIISKSGKTIFVYPFRN